MGKKTGKRLDPEIIKRKLLSGLFVKDSSVVASAAEELNLSREAVYKHLRQYIQEGIVIASGDGRSRKYSLADLENISTTLTLRPELDESRVWLDLAKPVIPKLSPEALKICEFGFTEIVNNAIDHSEGTELSVSIRLTALYVQILIMDDGIGIFEKIARAFQLAEAREAILELYKGKLTTDPSRHSGEGIFFSSRAFSAFSILSKGLHYHYESHDPERHGDWMEQLPPEKDTAGTGVGMTLFLPPRRALRSVFEEFASEENDFAFSKTHVPLRLAMIGDGNLISRSQAKRVLARFEKFDEVMLDFEGIQTIGQGFADEIFRVFKSQHPNILVRAINANEEVANMISRAVHHKSA